MNLTGLTDKQVQTKIRQGKVNIIARKNQTTLGKIILKNTLTIFNLVNLILALMIVFVGAYKNLLFILIAIANTLISIVNEIRAKKTVDKMRLISEQRPTVIRNGKTIQIEATEIVEGDLLVYSLGDQILVDSKLEDGAVEVNEAFVTGEQDNIEKKKGDKLISGSFVVSGTCKATAIAVGPDSELNKIEQTAHHLKTADSKLFTIMNNIVKYISFALIPIGALLLWARFRVPETTTEVAITSTVAALINMIPEGLILLTSSVLALATIRLSKKQVLVQDLYSVETLARVDTIALDKTGTLTTGKMTVHDYTQLEKSFEMALTSILTHQNANNSTITALKQKFLKKGKNKEIEGIIGTIDFSSDRKHSGIITKDAIYLLGAIDFVTNNPDIIKKVNAGSEGYRTLAVVKTTSQKNSSNCKLLGFIRLEDEIRPDAKQIINYFYENNIAVKIISGDDPEAVTKIAKRVGVKELSCINLSSTSSLNYNDLINEYSIFTRVTPNQKKYLIEAMKKQGNTVAMTGDGVNDILAMKEADVSIAIGEGSDAARRSAKLVLLDSGFESVPSIIDEGRQSINNLERSTVLFLTKTVYASILAVVFTIVPLEYPFSPIEMSLLNFACIGFPGLVLALEHNTARIKDQFVTNIKKYSVPTGIAIAVVMITLSIVATNINLSRPDLISISAVLTFIIDFMLIYYVSRPLNRFRAILLALIAGIFLISFFLPFTHAIFFLP